MPSWAAARWARPSWPRPASAVWCRATRMPAGARCSRVRAARGSWPKPAQLAIRASMLASLPIGWFTGSLPSWYDFTGALMSKSPEQRAAARIAATFKVKYESFDQFLVEYTQDLSRGGMFLVTRSFLPKNSVIRCVLYLPGTEDEVR